MHACHFNSTMASLIIASAADHRRFIPLTITFIIIGV